MELPSDASISLVQEENVCGLNEASRPNPSVVLISFAINSFLFLYFAFEIRFVGLTIGF